MRLTARIAITTSLFLVFAVAVAPVLAGDAPVSIAGKAFEPATLTLPPGARVVWTVTNSIGEPHSVTSGTPEDAGQLFDSGINLTDNGQSFDFTFNEPGEYLYFCVVHPVDMTGKVIVLAEGASPPPSSESPSGEPGEPGEEHTPVSTESKVLAGAILTVSLVLMFLMAWVWRRMNPA